MMLPILFALSQGWRVLPLRPEDNRPACRGGLREATRDPLRIQRYRMRHPGHNYGIPTGETLIVLEVHGPEGQQSLCARTAQQRERRPLPTTVAVSAGDRQQYYFRTDGEHVETSVGKLGPGLNVYGDGGYVVGPGSTDPSGHTYRYVAGREPASIQMASMPHWLLEPLRRSPPSTQPAPADAATAREKGQQDLRQLAPPGKGGPQSLRRAPRYAYAGRDPGVRKPYRRDVPAEGAEPERDDPPEDLVMTGAEIISGGFDYGQLDAGVAAEVREAADRVRGLIRASIIDVGHELLAIKDRISHGQFVAWVEHECQFKIRAAQRAMRAAEMVGKNDKLSYLPPDGLVALASRSASEPIVAEIIGQIETGAQPTAAEIKRRIKAARLEARTARADLVEPLAANQLDVAMRAVKALSPEDLMVLLMNAVKALSPEALVGFLTDVVKGLSPGALLGFLARMRETYPPEPASIGWPRASVVQPTPPEPGTAPKIPKPSPPTSEPTTPLITVWGAVPEKHRWATRNWVLCGYALGQYAPSGTPQSFADQWSKAPEAEKKAFRVEMLLWKAAP